MFALRRLLAPTALWFAVACSGSVVLPPTQDLIGDGVFTATPLVVAAAPGALVALRFTNAGDVAGVFNPCNRFVQRRVADAWVTLPDELRMCTAEAHFIPVQGAVERTTDVPADATPGTYRFVFPVIEDGPKGRTVELKSRPIEVR